MCPLFLGDQLYVSCYVLLRISTYVGVVCMVGASKCSLKTVFRMSSIRQSIVVIALWMWCKFQRTKIAIKPLCAAHALISTPAVCLGAGLFFQLCQVRGPAIIPKRNEPYLARGQTRQSIFLGILPSFSDLHDLTV
jgi:hypothetical protein